MENTVDASLPRETAAWCERAEEAVRNPPGGRCRCAELAREGVLLRRRWDRIDPDAPDRRRLLRLLPAVQSIAQRRLTEGVEDAGRADADPARLVVEQMVEDDQYVVGLLNDPSLSAESAAQPICDETDRGLDGHALGARRRGDYAGGVGSPLVGPRDTVGTSHRVVAGRLPSPYDTTAQVANQIGVLLSRLLDRVYWVADLYGTVTAPQLVDSMGEYMVKGSARPARRLVVVGVGFLAVTYLASLLSMPKLSVLDLKTYCDVVAELGEYDASTAEDPNGILP